MAEEPKKPNSESDFVIPLLPEGEADILSEMRENDKGQYAYVRTKDKKTESLYIAGTKTRNRLLTESNTWLKEIHTILKNSPIIQGVKDSLNTSQSEWLKSYTSQNDDLIDSINSDSMESQRNLQLFLNSFLEKSALSKPSSGDDKMVEWLRSEAMPLWSNTADNLETMKRYDKEEFSDITRRKKLTKSQNEQSGRLKEWIAEKGGFFRSLVWLGKSIYSTIAEFMGSTLWEIIKTVLFFLLFDPDGTFIKAIGNFVKDIINKIMPNLGSLSTVLGAIWEAIKTVGNAIWNALPDWLKNGLAETAIFISRIIATLQEGFGYVLQALGEIISTIPMTGGAGDAVKKLGMRALVAAERTDLRNEMVEAIQTRMPGLDTYKAKELADERAAEVRKRIDLQTSWSDEEIRAKSFEATYRNTKRWADMNPAEAFLEAKIRGFSTTDEYVIQASREWVDKNVDPELLRLKNKKRLYDEATAEVENTIKEIAKLQKVDPVGDIVSTALADYGLLKEADSQEKRERKATVLLAEMLGKNVEQTEKLVKSEEKKRALEIKRLKLEREKLAQSKSGQTTFQTTPKLESRSKGYREGR